MFDRCQSPLCGFGARHTDYRTYVGFYLHIWWMLGTEVRGGTSHREHGKWTETSQKVKCYFRWKVRNYYSVTWLTDLTRLKSIRFGTRVRY